MKLKIKKLLITVAVMLGLAFAVMCLNRIFEAPGAHDALRLVGDGLFVIGMLGLGVVALSWVGSEGMFDGLKYTTKTLLSLKWSAFGDFREGYREYKANKKKQDVMWELLVASGILVVLSIICTVLFYTV